MERAEGERKGEREERREERREEKREEERREEKREGVEERESEVDFQTCGTLATWIVIFMAPNLCCKVRNYDNWRYMRREVRTDILCMQPSLATFLHHLQYEYRIIPTASDDTCGGGLGTRLAKSTTVTDRSWI